ncbi:MAG: hypothetical protein Q4D37_00685 [Oscillospiraceae bacterium]|nr:hypothetical protein [Oscillospiraceae bacterium]
MKKEKGEGIILGSIAKSTICNTGNELPVVSLPPRAAVHTVLAKPMALQPLLAALQTTPLFAIEDSR